MRNSRSGAPSKLDPTSSRSALRFLSVNGTGGILRCGTTRHWRLREHADSEMGRIVVSENVSLDGVIQDPSGDDGFDRGGWVGKVTDRKEAGQVLVDEALSADAEL